MQHYCKVLIYQARHPCFESEFCIELLLPVAAVIVVFMAGDSIYHKDFP